MEMQTISQNENPTKFKYNVGDVLKGTVNVYYITKRMPTVDGMGAKDIAYEVWSVRMPGQQRFRYTEEFLENLISTHGMTLYKRKFKGNP